jgi:chromosome segregation ATPase
MSEVKIIIEEIKELINTTSRIDERVKFIAEAHSVMNDRLDSCIESSNVLSTKMSAVESYVVEINDKFLKLKSRLEALEAYKIGKLTNLFSEMKVILEKMNDRLLAIESERRAWGHRISTIVSYIWQGTYIICICYLLYKLGLNNPPIP